MRRDLVLRDGLRGIISTLLLLLLLLFAATTPTAVGLARTLVGPECG